MMKMSFCPACQSDFPPTYNQCPHDGSVLLSSNRLGKYEIVARIGEGGMGAVYRAINPDTRADVAVKLLHARAAEKEGIRKRFQREAEAVAGLRTQHIVRIFDFGADGDVLYLVMELLEGQTLRDEIANRGAMSAARLEQLLDGALRGLAAAHRAGVTHRDLKPENIFITETDDGEVVKLLDFGIARVADTQLTDTGALMGTPAYMAPEQVATTFGTVGPHSDCYSMGVIAYEMLCGISPFLSSTGGSPLSVTEVLGRVVDRKFEPLATIRPDLPESTIQFVEHAMAADPQARFVDADAMRTGLTGKTPHYSGASGTRRLAPTVKSGPSALAPTHATDLAGEAADAYPMDDPPKRGRLWMVLAALAVVGGALAAVVALRDSGDAKAPAPAVATVADAAAAVIEPEVFAPEGMVRLAGGAFEMGSAKFEKKLKAAQSPHEVTVAPFWLDRFEVHDSAKMPVANLSHRAAKAHCEALGKRLPSEEEWEYAARRSELSGARMLAAGDRGPAKVGTHEGDCTSDGICDLLGNLAEWTSTAWVDGRGKKKPGHFAVRGGSFSVKAGAGFNSTVFARFAVGGSESDIEVGFRCALEDPPARAEE